MMKTIRLLFSTALFVGLTIFFANLQPPNSQTTHLEALQSSQKIETVHNSSLTEKPAVDTKPAAQQPQPTPVETPKPADPPPQPTTHEELMQAAGISQADWPAVDYIVSHESGWCATKWEGEYGACPAFHGVSDVDGYGMCQSTPPQKMAVAGDDWQTNGVTQLKWCSMYAQSRYGGWWASYHHWLSHHNW